jgi:hypothetical protein
MHDKTNVFQQFQQKQPSGNCGISYQCENISKAVNVGLSLSSPPYLHSLSNSAFLEPWAFEVHFIMTQHPPDVNPMPCINVFAASNPGE